MSSKDTPARADQRQHRPAAGQTTRRTARPATATTPARPRRPAPGQTSAQVQAARARSKPVRLRTPTKASCRLVRRSWPCSRRWKKRGRKRGRGAASRRASRRLRRPRRRQPRIRSSRHPPGLVWFGARLIRNEQMSSKEWLYLGSTPMECLHHKTDQVKDTNGRRSTQ